MKRRCSFKQHSFHALQEPHTTKSDAHKHLPINAHPGREIPAFWTGCMSADVSLHECFQIAGMFYSMATL